MDNLILETERLVLRPIELNDYDDLINIVSDSEVVSKMEDFQLSPEEFKDFLDYDEEQWLYECSEQCKFAFAVILKEKIIGYVCSYLCLEVPGIRECRLGYFFDKRVWKNGFATEAIIKLIEFSVNCLDVNKIVALTDSTNINSCHLLEKLGMYKVNEWSEAKGNRSTPDIPRISVKYEMEI